MSEGVRLRRKADVSEGTSPSARADVQIDRGKDSSASLPLAAGAGAGASSFWLTRIVFLRSLAFIYMVAFTVALNQVRRYFSLSVYFKQFRTERCSARKDCFRPTHT